MFNCRNTTDPGHNVEEAIQSDNSSGERWGSVGLQDQGGSDGNAQGRGEEQSRGRQDAVRVGRQPQLQGHQGPDAPLLQRHLQNRSYALRNAVARSCVDWSTGSSRLAGGPSGQLLKFTVKKKSMPDDTYKAIYSCLNEKLCPMNRGKRLFKYFKF